MTAGESEHRPDTVLDHDHDGNQENDKRLPNWWLWTLWGSIVFALAYWLVFHTYGLVKLPIASYEQEMAASSLRGLTEADLEAMVSDPARLAMGKEVYTKNCLVCHLAEGQGLVGSNLTDDYWVHGGNALEIHDIVVQGVVEKGMAAFGSQLGPDRVDAVVAYLLTLRGTHVEGKAPEGDLWTPEPAAEPESIEDSVATEEGATAAVEG